MRQLIRGADNPARAGRAELIRRLGGTRFESRPTHKGVYEEKAREALVDVTR